MAKLYFPADGVRQLEAATGPLLTNGTLMRRAAAGVAHVVARELRSSGGVYGRRVGVVVGVGDNGGDALFAGAFLARRGVSCVAVLLAPQRTHAAGLAAFRRSGGGVVEALPEGLDLVLDGVVGIGGSGPLRPAAAKVFATVRAPIVAVDLPSGVDADTGRIHEPAVCADVTVTFGVPRLAHLLAAPQCGRIEIVDIGLRAADALVGDGVQALTELSDADVGAAWPVPGPRDDKYTQGVVGVIAGSQRYPGAAVLATGGALAATSGMTRYVGTAREEVLRRFPEIVATDDLADAGRVQAWVIGPGAGTDEAAARRLKTVLAADLPVVVDADGLTVLAEHLDWVRERTAPTVLTPHAGEFARLTGEPVGEDRMSAVQRLSEDLGATVLLKGRATLIVEGHAVFGNDAGSSWASTAGAGDVLSGIIGALLAADLPPARAAAMAARVHARAAQLASTGAPIGASELLAAVRPAIRKLRRKAATP